MPSTIQHMLQEHKEEQESGQQALQEETISTILRDLITYEMKTLSEMNHMMTDKAPRLHSLDASNLAATSGKSRDELLDQFEKLRIETLSFLTRRLPQDWEKTALDPGGESLTLRQYTTNLTEHDRNARNQLRIDLEKRR